ncbi:DUF2169 family type VI secretion system accessory protein [Marinomonas mediterranea]|uniref:DUF2169 family type VI secretion system accessory protein n=1 Tax=Marinomonas mediterranea TaxID=119864 RepID=UPI00234A4D57|nr:DUF2169 domain-containing protein [Marinomonas mediterranea]WCN10227.1 DUF2169 domain-containing protein [Marinomonas mediterranea]
MIEVLPQGGLQAQAFQSWNATGEKVWVVAVKASYAYDLDGSVTCLETSEPLTPADRYPEDDPANFALNATTDLVPFKKGAEILLYAHAYSEQPTHRILVKAELKTVREHWQKQLVVIGPRYWRRRLLDYYPSNPELITELPVSYEYAFGGKNPYKEHDVYLANPVGRGYVARGKAKGNPLPQVEHLNDLIKKPRYKAVPYGFGPIGLHWESRYKLFPEIDERALHEGEFPYRAALPKALYNSAPKDQQLENTLIGMVSVKLTGMTKGLSATESLTLPLNIPSIECQMITRQQTQTTDLQADTLIIDTKEKRLHLVYRHSMAGFSERFQAQAAVKIKDEEHECESLVHKSR